MIDLALSIFGVLVAITGLFFGHLYYVHGRKPKATEIASELRQSLRVGSDDIFMRKNSHVVNNIDVKVTNTSDWLDQRDYSNEQWGYVYLNGVFVGHCEIIQFFEIPDSPPDIEKIRRHPYYGEPVTFQHEYSGTEGFEVETWGENLVTNVDFYADSVRKGSSSITMTLLIVAEIIDDVLSGRADDPEKIPPFDEFMSEGIQRDGIKFPFVPVDRLSETDFEFPEAVD